MAKTRNGSAASPKATAAMYLLARVTRIATAVGEPLGPDDVLTVVASSQTARTAGHALDAFVDRLPPSDTNEEFTAIPVRYIKIEEYATENPPPKRAKVKRGGVAEVEPDLAPEPV